jgi:transposase
MGVVGADVHTRTHTFVAVDEVGWGLDPEAFPANAPGHRDAIRWARQRFGRELRWAIEDCRHLSARLEGGRLTAGGSVVRVPPKTMAEQRHIARTRGKSDPIDALAVARTAQREPDLPVASHDEQSRELKLPVDRSDDPDKHRTPINRMPWHVHEIDPELAPPKASLDRAVRQQELPDRGNTKGRVRVTRSGNRQLNAAIHRIAVTQIRLDGLGKSYYDKQKAEGTSTPEALRCFRRRLAGVVFNHLTPDQAATATGLAAAA